MQYFSKSWYYALLCLPVWLYKPVHYNFLHANFSSHLCIFCICPDTASCLVTCWSLLILGIFLHFFIGIVTSRMHWWLIVPPKERKLYQCTTLPNMDVSILIKGQSITSRIWYMYQCYKIKCFLKIFFTKDSLQATIVVFSVPLLSTLFMQVDLFQWVSFISHQLLSIYNKTRQCPFDKHAHLKQTNSFTPQDFFVFSPHKWIKTLIKCLIFETVFVVVILFSPTLYRMYTKVNQLSLAHSQMNN